MAKQYIYERDDWPALPIDEKALREPLANLRQTLGRLYGKLEAFGFTMQSELLLRAVSDEIIASSEIEGEYLQRSSVRSSVARRLGLEATGQPDGAADRYTEGVVDIAIDATQNHPLPVTSERLFGWHAALFPTGWSSFRRITVGAYRLGDVAIVSGAIGNERVHYKAPDPKQVPAEMKAFLAWLETPTDMDQYVKAALAHLRFESIHPFDDGNGRIGRAIADLMLARADHSAKRYYSLSAQLLHERKAYYDELEIASGYHGDIHRWIAWFLGCVIRAMEASEEVLEEVKGKAAFFSGVRHIAMNERQISMLNRLIDGFEGKLTTDKWAKLCKCSHDTALRDIDDLIKKGVLSRSTEGGRSTSYILIR
ncbi:MAG: Fic family protein [Clostridiales bacterium]|nr:Fic family protein [Clostridiales bacterium]